MAKQFHFYLLPSDANHLVENIKQKLEVHLLAPESEGPDPIEIQSPLAKTGDFVRISCFLARSINSAIRTDYIKNQRYWSIDTLYSEAIEFSGCHYNGKSLKRGRMFYNTGYYDDRAIWIDKSDPFLAWADDIFKTTKRLLKRDPKLDAYLGQDARRFLQSGGYVAT